MDSQKKKIFLVDDDQFLLNMYTIKFTNSGFEVESATTGQAALQKLRDGFSPDAVLFDIVMPSMDGLELLSHVKEEKLATGARFIALTNQGQSADIERGKNIGVDGYIVKASAIPSEIVNEVGIILKSKIKNQK